MEDLNTRAFYELDAERFHIWSMDAKHSFHLSEMLKFHSLIPYVGSRKKILDIGCGAGYMSYLMAKAGNQIVTVDISHNRMLKFKDIASQYSIKQVIGDINAHNFKDNQFDLITCLNVVEHMQDCDSLLKHIFRMLKKGGEILIGVPYNQDLRARTARCIHCLKTFHQDGHLHSFDEAKLHNLLTRHGFSLKKTIFCVNGASEYFKYKLHPRFSEFWLTVDKSFSRFFPHKCRQFAVLAVKE